MSDVKGNEHHRLAAALMNNDACGNDYATMALIESNLAIAFELRTANLLAAQSTPEWLNEARVRMGHETFPPGTSA